MDAGSIVVYFKAQTAELRKGIDESSKMLGTFKSALVGLGVGAAFVGITHELNRCIEASSEAQMNVRKLQGVISDPSDITTFQDLASELSHVTAYSDDAAMSALSLLGKFDLTDRQMGQMLPKVADFAAFMGMDLPQAAEVAGKAIANGSGGLRGLGLSFSDAEKKAFDMASQQERTNILLDRMTSKFGGVAEAAVKTGAGGMQRFKNEIGELEEAIGALIDAPVGAFFGSMADMISGVSSSISEMQQNVTLFVAVTGALASAVGSVISTGNFSSVESFIEGVQANFQAGLVSIQAGLAKTFDAPKASGDRAKKSLDDLDNAARKTAASVAAIDFKSELQQQLGGVLDTLQKDVAAIDFSQHKNDFDVDTTVTDEARSLDIGESVSEGIAAEGRQDYQGMSSAAIKARAAEVAQTVDDTDVALAGLKGGLGQLAGKLGSVGGVIQNAMASVAKGDVVGAVVGVGVEMLTRTKSFGKLMQGLEGIFTALSQVLEPIVAAVLPFLDIISQLLPVVVAMNYPLKALSAIVQAVGNTLKQVINFLGGFWNGAIETIASFVSKIPFVGDDIAQWIRDAKIDLTAEVEDTTLTEAVNTTAENVTNLGDTAQKTADQLKNVPEGFKIAAARFAAITAGEGDVSPTAPRSTPAAGGTTYRLPPMLSRDDLVTGRANTRPGALPTNINIQNLSVTSNDPSTTAGTLAAAAKRDTFLRTGQTASGETTRAFWGA